MDIFHQFVQQPKAVCFFRIEHLSRLEITTASPYADGFHHIGRNHAGQQAQLHFGETEFRRLYPNGNITGGDQPEAAAISRALYKGDGRLWNILQVLQHPTQRQGVFAVIFFGKSSRPFHPVQIGTGAVTLTRGGNHNGADTLLMGQILEHITETLDKLFIESIMNIRAVQGNGGDAIR